MDRTAWNQFVLEHGPRSGRFLQSWEWGEFQKAVGEQVRREEIVVAAETRGVAQCLDRQATAFVHYSYCPKGPVVGKGIGGLEGLGERKGTMFLRIEPDESSSVGRAVKSIDLSPSHTRITELSATDDELLAYMHPKTRYNIRVAQKNRVNVDLIGGHFASAWKLFEQTASRGQFRLHPRGYYEAMLAQLTGDCRAFLATASHEGQLLAANIMIDFGSTRTYLHGASSSQHRGFMAPYLLHWELLRDAREQGMSSYDWWGVAPVDAPQSHPWAGISRFKRGFPGEEYASPGTYDVVLQPRRYRFYQCVRSLLRIARRFL